MNIIERPKTDASMMLYRGGVFSTTMSEWIPVPSKVMGWGFAEAKQLNVLLKKWRPPRGHDTGLAGAIKQLIFNGYEWKWLEPRHDTGLAGAIKQLDLLLMNQNVNDYVFKPTDHAYRQAKSILVESRLIMRSRFSQPSIIPDGEGGIDIEWTCQAKEVLVCCRANAHQRDYIYYQEGETYGSKDMSNEFLRDRLMWLIQ